MLCWKNCKQYTKIHSLYRTCSIPFHHHKKNNERIRCLKPPCEKSRALNKEKDVLREYSKIFSPCLPRTPPFSFIPRNYSTVFIEFNKFLLQLTWHCFALFLTLCSSLLMVRGTDFFYFFHHGNIVLPC